MRLFPQDALNPGVRKREVFGWSMYDFANSGYTTVVLTAVFSAYFVGSIAGGATWATLAWTATLSAASLLVMLTMPAIGAYADLRAAKKPLLLASTVGCVAATAALGWAGPGDIVFAVIIVMLATMFFNYGESLIAAFLPELARPDSLGKVSGWGWSFGYFGGMLALGLGLAWVLAAQARGEPATQFVPVTMWITAALFALASVFTFVLLKERALPQPESVAGHGFASSLARLARTWREARNFRDFTWLLACAVAYQAGVSVVVVLAAVYAAEVLGFGQAQTMALIFLVNIAAVIGAFSWGYVQDLIGHRAALAATLVGWIVMTLLAGLAVSATLFWIAAVIAGLCMGSSQSAGRALAGLFAPAARRAEFYGLWTFALRVSAILGPLTYGVVHFLAGGNHRVAIVSTGLFFVIGLLLLLPINVARGAAAAEQANGAAGRGG